MALQVPTRHGTQVLGTTQTLTSASFTPTAGALVIVVATASGGAAATGASAAVSGTGGLTWTHFRMAPAAATSEITVIGTAVAPTATAQTVTITWSGAPTSGTLTVNQITDDAGSPSVSATNFITGTSTTTGTLSMTLPAAPATTSYVFGAFGTRNKATAMTVGSGYTALINHFAASPSASLLLEYRTGSTSTTVDASALGTVYSAGVGIEVLAAAPPAAGRVRRMSKRR